MVLEIARKLAHKTYRKFNPVNNKDRMNVEQPQVKFQDIRSEHIVRVKPLDGVESTKTVEISAKVSSFASVNEFMAAIPEDAVLVGDKAKAFKSQFGKVLEAIGVGLDPDLGQITNTGKVIKSIPSEIMEELRLLVHPEKGITARQVMFSLATIYGYIGLSVAGGVAAVGLPNLDALGQTVNALAATALLVGILASRARTTLSFQHTVLRALSRGPEYYTKFDGFEAERIRSAGMDFNPTRLEDPYKVFKDSPKIVTAIYARNEAEVLERSLEAHTLFEIRDRQVIIGADPAGRPDKGQSQADVDKEYRQNIDAVRSRVELLRNFARNAQSMMGDASRRRLSEKDKAKEACADLIGALGKIRGEYKKREEYYQDEAVEKFESMEQGSACGLDEYASVQYLQHGRVWEERIKILSENLESLNSGKITPEQMMKHLKGYYEYLENKFTFDVIYNPRESKIVDMGLYGKVSGAVVGRLTTSGLNVNTAVTEASFVAIRKAMEEEYKTRRPIGAMFTKFMNAITGTAPDKGTSAYIYESIQKGKTISQVANELVMQELTRAQFMRGAKAGARSAIFNRLGKTFVTFRNALGTDILMTKQEWQENISRPSENDSAWIARMNCSLMLGNAGFAREAAGVITAFLTADQAGVKLTKEEGRRLIDRLKTELNITDKTKIRMMESLEESFLNDGGNAKDFLKEATIIAFYDKALEWATFMDADFVGSFDKDYVPLSIDPYTGEFQDMFRQDMPMWLKWSRDEHRQNIALVQNPQDQEHYMVEGPMKDGKRLKTTNGVPLEGVAHVSQSDQMPWYGANVIGRVLDKFLRKSADKLTGEEFLTQVAEKLYRERGFFRVVKKGIKAVAKVFGKSGPTDAELDVLAAVRKDMAGRGINMGATMDRTNGQHILESIKRHAQEVMVATGIGPGRGFFGAMFSCGTCELEYVPGMKLGFNRPYVIGIDGNIMAQAELRYNARTGKMEIYELVPRFADIMGGLRAAVESKEEEVRETVKITGQDKARLVKKYSDGGKKAVKIFGNKVYVIDKASHRIETVMWWYFQTNEATGNERTSKTPVRKMEVDYTQLETVGKIFRDYDPEGKTYYETKLDKGTVKDESFVSKNSEEDIDITLSNLYMSREIIGEPVIEEIGGNEVRIHIKTKLPEIMTEYVNGEYKERMVAPASHQPDKWITEDMATTYYHMLLGWATETHPGEVGSAVGPSDLADLLIQHHRWFKGGFEVYLDFQKVLNANPQLAYTMQGKYMKQAFLWPMQAVTDIPLYLIPSTYWLFKYLLPDGVQPVAAPLAYAAMFALYLPATVGVFKRVMGQMGYSWGEIWDKEAFLAISNIVYLDACKQGTTRANVPFATTAAGDRKPLKVEYLLGMQGFKEISASTAVVGGVSTAAFALQLGLKAPAGPIAYLGDFFNFGWPAFKWWLISRGINKLYGYWTMFDANVKERAEMFGAGNINISSLPDGSGLKTMSFTLLDKTNPKKVLAKLKEIADIEVLDNNGNPLPAKKMPKMDKKTGITTVNLRMSYKPITDGGQYESYEKAVWVDGKTNFKHDMKVQMKEYQLKLQLEKAVKAGDVATADRVLADMMAEKARKTAMIEGQLQKVELSKEENNLISGAPWGPDAKKPNHIRTLQGMIKAQGKIKDKSAKEMEKYVELSLMLARTYAAINKPDEVIKIVKDVLSNKANNGAAKEMLKKVVLKAGVGSTNILLHLDKQLLMEVLGGLNATHLSKVAANMLPFEEANFIGTIERAFAGTPNASMVDVISGALYGVDNATRESIFAMARNIDAGQNVNKGLAALAKIFRAEQGMNIPAISQRLLGADCANALGRFMGRGN
jgi:hypothetical protein